MSFQRFFAALKNLNKYKFMPDFEKLHKPYSPEEQEEIKKELESQAEEERFKLPSDERTPEELELELREEKEKGKEPLPEEIEATHRLERQPDTQKIESLRKEILEGDAEKTDDVVENKTSLVKKIRLRHNFDSTPVDLPAKEKELIIENANESEARLKRNYAPGFGLFPCSDTKENFYNQIWTRDLGHATGNYFANKEPKAVLDSFKTIFKFQREDGMLPFRVEKTYGLMKVMPPFLHISWLAQPLFNLIQKRIRGINERPRYEGQSGSSAQDTVPTILIAIGEFYLNSEQGKEFVKENYDKITKAVDFFRTKSDPKDGLIDVKKGNADWADSINRGGKLGNINVWWARSLRMLEFIANDLGHEEDVKKYRDEFHKVRSSVMEKLYNKEKGYFRAKEGEDRVDAVASVFGSLYLLNPTEAVRVQETLKKMATPAGIKNFDPPYSNEEIMFALRLVNHGGYHNEDVWPWVTLQNIQAKIKIALQHPDEKTRNQYKKESVKDLADVAGLFKNAGGAYEIFNAKTRKPHKEKRRGFLTTYKPPKNIMGNMAAFDSAYQQVKELGWL
jgi:hypothetical protein